MSEKKYIYKNNKQIHKKLWVANITYLKDVLLLAQ